MFDFASKLISFTPVVLNQNLAFGSGTFDRTPEPTSEMEGNDSVQQYVRGAKETQLFLTYAMALKHIYQIGQDYSKKSALDVACGTGHFTMELARFFPFSQVTGIDISEPMVKRAQADPAKSPSVKFEIGDALKLDNHQDNSFFVSTFNQAAHHLSINEVESVFAQLDRITSPEGLILSTDLVRLKNATTTKRYVDLVSSDYAERKLAAFANDFENSMYAAWSLKELADTIPTSRKRKWFQISPRLLPTTQIIVGIPHSQNQIYRKRGTPWKKTDGYIPKHLKAEWTLFTNSLTCGRVSEI